MIYEKQIECPICGKKISKMGGGFANHWGIAKCDNCGNWINFDTEMIASDKEIEKETTPLLPDEVQPNSEHSKGPILGEVGEANKYQSLFTHHTPGILTHHASQENFTDISEGLKAAIQPYVDSDNQVLELTDYYASRYNLFRTNIFLTADVTKRAMSCQLDLSELEEIVCFIAHRAVRLQRMIEKKDNLIKLYQKQEEARKQYQKNCKETQHFSDEQLYSTPVNPNKLELISKECAINVHDLFEKYGVSISYEKADDIWCSYSQDIYYESVAEFPLKQVQQSEEYADNLFATLYLYDKKVVTSTEDKEDVDFVFEKIQQRKCKTAK